MTAVSHRCDKPGGGWTLDTLQEHHEALAAANEKFLTERDRRYTEVSAEREKALKVKDAAEEKALSLAREIQIYKDEKANELREQINSERGLYASKADLAAAQRELTAMIQPLSTYVAGQAGQKKQSASATTNLVATISVIYGISATIGVVATIIFALMR